MKTIVKAILLSGAVAFGLGVNPASAQHEHGEHEHGAQEHGEEAGHSRVRVEGHGGVVTMSKEFHIETVFMPDQVRLYLYDGSQNPIHVKHWEKGLVEATGVVDFIDRGRGTATLKFERAAPSGYACPMHADEKSSKPGKCAECGMKLVKQGLPEGTLWSCPMHPDENGKSQARCADCGMRYMPQDYLVARVNLAGLKAGEARASIDLKNLPGPKEKTVQVREKYVPAKMSDQQEKGEHGHDGHDHSGHGHNP